MAERNEGAVKRQRVAVVESALANIDVVSQFAAFLEAKDLCQVKATCKALGSANDDAAINGLSVTEEAARRAYEGASDEEKAMLPRYIDESWTELYHHLLMLRARLTFDQLVGIDIEYRDGDKAAVRSFGGRTSAVCGNHVMRAGKHWATFTCTTTTLYNLSVGVIRPLPGWEKRGLDSFNPALREFRSHLLRERTVRWEGDVDYCCFYVYGQCYCSNWEGTDSQRCHWEGIDDYDRRIKTLGMLLDLDIGTLSLYQNGRRLGTLKDGLAGVYCWITCLGGNRGDESVSIKRGYDLNDV